jgi:catecholate siderophore receptor
VASIRSRKRGNDPSFRLTGSAAATLLLFAVPNGAAVAQVPATKTLPVTNVTAPAVNDYKPPETLSSPKYTAPLLDTPQSITVIPKKVIEDQNLQGLREILATVPGITFGAGEGGGGFGDSIMLRGFSSNNDITIDGVRDSAQYTRSDTFNLEQIEVINGANSVYSGAGSVGGSINLVSKTPKADNFAIVQGGLGTDSYGRATADVNRVIEQGTAVRLNLMAHKNDVPGRDYEEFERWGVAPSITFGLNSPTSVTLSYVHQHDENLPQYGVPYSNNREFGTRRVLNRGPLPGVDPSSYFGYHNVDTQEIDTDMFTATLNHEFNKNLSVRNLTRWQKTKQYLVASNLGGTWCLANGLNPFPDPPEECGAPDFLPGTFTPTSRGALRDSENTILYNQTDITTKFNTGPIEHTLVAGFSFSSEDYRLENGSVVRDADGEATDPYPAMDINDPNSYWAGPRNKVITGIQDGEVQNTSVYVFDTLKFNEQWEFNGGVRLERNESEHKTDANLDTDNPRLGDTFHNDDTLFSYRAGIVFKPVQNASIYFAYGNSETPSKATVNGSCASVSNSGDLTNNCNVDPEEAEIYELGVKWDLLDNQLSLTASIFRNDRTNYRVSSGIDIDDSPLGFEQNTLDGQARVDGFLLGIGGLITRKWSIFANYAYLDSEVIQGASDFVSDEGEDYTKGDPLRFVPKHALSLWTTYDIGHGWQVGYGATYQGETYVTQHSEDYPDGPLQKSDSYWVHRAMVAYRVNRQLGLQLNVNNLFDKEYYERIRNNAGNGWATPGAGRQAVLTATYQF